MMHNVIAVACRDRGTPYRPPRPLPRPRPRTDDWEWALVFFYL